MRRGGRIRTPGSLPERESCIRTLIVSRGWQHSWEHNVRRPDVYVFWGTGVCTYSFHGTRYAACCQVGREPNGFLLGRHGRPLVIQRFAEGVVGVQETIPTVQVEGSAPSFACENPEARIIFLYFF